jgi:hypothetical protein
VGFTVEVRSPRSIHTRDLGTEIPGTASAVAFAANLAAHTRVIAPHHGRSHRPRGVRREILPHTPLWSPRTTDTHTSRAGFDVKSCRTHPCGHPAPPTLTPAASDSPRNLAAQPWGLSASRRASSRRRDLRSAVRHRRGQRRAQDACPVRAPPCETRMRRRCARAQRLTADNENEVRRVVRTRSRARPPFASDDPVMVRRFSRRRRRCATCRLVRHSVSGRPPASQLAGGLVRNEHQLRGHRCH